MKAIIMMPGAACMKGCTRHRLNYPGDDEFLDVVRTMEYNNIILNDRRLYRKMERASHVFRKIMLGILLLIMSAALLLTAVNGLTQHSYLIALLAGAVWAFILYRL